MKKRFFISKENIVNESKILLSGEENLHLTKVLRMREGDVVECFFSGSEVFVCEIVSISKNCSELKILNSYPCTANPKKEITLFQGLPKLDKLDVVTQKLVELGASYIVPFSSKFCIAKANDNKIERLNKIVVSACKQCGRTKLLEVYKAVKFDEMVKMLQDYDLVLFANEKEDSKSFSELLGDLKNAQKIAYIVGSEGGFSDDEIEKLKNLTQSISLGSRILRTETASVALCALISNLSNC